ncbi:bacillibactin transport transcriptional regulator Btr [Paenibacillus sp. JCM 10914]|uniref:AraC family transcriptional regulator n=1 Tax=Paenibacillus sp. JCM 10914 TaxID=1236974 RepID=UPI0018D18660|nr:AraC family transcriptional regulator [Paenibacillus sp. JCM 10914]
MLNEAKNDPTDRSSGTASRLEQPDIMARLWNVEIFHAVELPMEQQLTFQPALVIPFSGEANLYQAKQLTRMIKGCAYYCAPGSTFGIQGCTHAFSMNQEQIMVAIVHFDLYQASDSSGAWMRAEASAFMPSDGLFVLGSPERIHMLCRSLHRNLDTQSPMERWRVQLDFQEMIYTMLSENDPRSKNGRVQALERVKEYIEEHFDEDITIDQLAALADLSPKYLVEVYKKTYGLSAMEYLAQIRLNKAKQFMLGSDALLRDIAHIVGYKDEFYFSRKFKKAFGISPSQYLKNQKNKWAMYGSSTLLGYAIPLHFTPYAAPLHPKWSQYYYDSLGPEIPVQLDAYRQNHNKAANLAKLAAARPEFIICAAGIDDWEREQLKQIAPIFEMPGEEAGWQHNLLELARIVDRQHEAAVWIQSFQRKIEHLREALPEMDKREQRLLTARLHLGKMQLYHHRGMRELLYEQLNFIPAIPFELTEGELLTIEQMKNCNAHHILLLIRQDSETLAHWRELQASPEWLNIPAVRAGTFHQLSSYPWREYSPVAMERMADEALRLFSDKNP